MKRLFLFFLLLAVFLFSAPGLFAQTCTAPLDFCESAWTINVVGSYSTITNAPTNNGFMTEAGVRFASHWSGEMRYYMTASPSGKIMVAGPQFDYGLAHFIKPTASFDTSSVNLFVHASPGLAWSSGTGADGQTITGAKKFAFAIGGGADYAFASAPNVQLRLIEVSYVRAPMLPNGGEFIGNHLQVGAGLRLVFGGTTTPAAIARASAHRAKKMEQLQRELKSN